jgi:hypothetical protein
VGRDEEPRHLQSSMAAAGQMWGRTVLITGRSRDREVAAGPREPPEWPRLTGFRPTLGRLIPEWRQPHSVADESLVFLGEAVLRLLRALSHDSGCLLVLEDLHWADRETLALLEYLADNLARERVLCVGTLRDEEGGQAAALAGLLEVRGSASVLRTAHL